MKSALVPFLAAVALALAGAGFWLAGHTETRLADVHKQLATLHYADAQSHGAAVEQSQSLALERRVPMLGKATETDARDARAAAGYWRTDYAAIAPQHDPNGVITENDPAILLLNASRLEPEVVQDTLNLLLKFEGDMTMGGKAVGEMVHKALREGGVEG